ncbi:MAG: molybdenum ABC transporter permease [Bacteroidota bacterium]
MTIFFAILLLIIGVLVLYFTGRRRFYRRGFSGLQQFRSYEAAVFIRLLENLFRLLAWILILAGLSLLLVFWYNH